MQVRNDGRVWVVDSKNHERILGTMPRPLMLQGTEFALSYVVGPYTDPALYWGGDWPPRPSSVRFSKVFVEADGGWSQIGVLATSAPLESLMCLPDFRLPHPRRP